MAMRQGKSQNTAGGLCIGGGSGWMDLAPPGPQVFFGEHPWPAMPIHRMGDRAYPPHQIVAAAPHYERASGWTSRRGQVSGGMQASLSSILV